MKCNRDGRNGCSVCAGWDINGSWYCANHCAVLNEPQDLAEALRESHVALKAYNDQLEHVHAANLERIKALEEALRQLIGRCEMLTLPWEDKGAMEAARTLLNKES